MGEPKKSFKIEDRYNSSPINANAYKTGAVTFLDVLGWKGIWRDSQGSREKNALDKLSMLIEEIDNKAKEIARTKYRPNLVKNEPRGSLDRGKAIEVKTLSISDTIVILTYGSAYDVIDIHCEVCSWALNKALNMGLPLRRAISYGVYDNKNNIMIGPAVDEAASWHESTDWIGVILTPSVVYALKNRKPLKAKKYSKIPYKGSAKGPDWCVKWSYRDDTGLNKDNDIYALFSSKSPHMQDVAPKYLNTLEFLNSR